MRPTAILPPAPDDRRSAACKTAFTARPDLAALNDSFTAARQFSTAERDLWMPTVSALAAAGGTPVRADQIQSSWYGAAGANISIPVFNGFLYNAEAQEAKLRAQAARRTSAEPARHDCARCAHRGPECAELRSSASPSHRKC